MRLRGAGIVAAMLALVLVSACGSKKIVSRPMERESFRNISELYARAEVVVEGVVAATSAGSSYGSGHGAVQARNVTVTPIEFFKGPSTSSVVMEERGWEGATPIEVEGYPPSYVGERAFWFLIHGFNTANYVVINSQSTYALTVTGDLVPVGGQHDALSELIDSYDPDQFREELRDQ